MADGQESPAAYGAEQALNDFALVEDAYYGNDHEALEALRLAQSHKRGVRT